MCGGERCTDRQQPKIRIRKKIREGIQEGREGPWQPMEKNVKGPMDRLSLTRAPMTSHPHSVVPNEKKANADRASLP